MTHAARIVTIDIETAPILAYVWGLFKQYVGIDQIVEDWSILSVTWKWLGEDETHYVDTYQNGLANDIRDDSELLKQLWQVLHEADIVISQNGKKFDVRKINARFIQAGMKPPSPYKQIDTREEAYKVAAFTSNKLAWLAQAVNGSAKDKHQDFPGFELWAECLKRNPKAWEAMRKYNPIDVIETEKLYLNLRPYIVGHPNVAAYDDDVKMRCPKCGSSEIQKRGIAVTQSGKFQRLQCFGCGGWSRERYTGNSIEKRRSLLSN